MKSMLLVLCLLLSPATEAANIAWLAGIYTDTMNKVNIKGGIVLNGREEKSGEDGGYHSRSFNYADVEFGLEGSKITLGAGTSNFESLGRIGISYAELHGDKLAGVESVVSAMGGSFKLGYYAGLNGAADEFLIGFGIGF
jgi:hypothetical protein